MWVCCCHPLADRGEEDRMITRYATSVDGHTTCLKSPPLRGWRGVLGRHRWPAQGEGTGGEAQGAPRACRAVSLGEGLGLCSNDEWLQHVGAGLFALRVDRRWRWY
jgi:hypothetical protein